MLTVLSMYVPFILFSLSKGRFFGVGAKRLTLIRRAVNVTGKGSSCLCACDWVNTSVVPTVVFTICRVEL